MNKRENFSEEYKILSRNDSEGKIQLIQNVNTGQLCVRKKLSFYQTSIYEYLMDNPVSGMPEIYSVREFKRPDYSPASDTKESADARKDVNGPAFLEVIEEYIPGRTLQSIIDDRGLLSEKEAVDIILQTGKIVGKLHSLPDPIVHRDIKPSNVIINNEGQVFLLDINAAKWVDTSKSKDTRLLGTAGYAAPEQYGFMSSDLRTDVFGLGVMLNVLLTGHLPSEGKAEGTLGKIVSKATAFSPEDRFANAGELTAELGRYPKIYLKNTSDRTFPSETNYKNQKTTDKSVNKDQFKQDSGAEGYKNPESSNKKRPSHSWTRFLPPGYRTLKPWRIVLSSLGYLLLFAVTTADPLNDRSASYNMADSIALTVVSVVIILFSGNYLGVQDRIGISKIKSRPLRLMVIVASDFLFIVLSLMGAGLVQLCLGL